MFNVHEICIDLVYLQLYIHIFEGSLCYACFINYDIDRCVVCEKYGAPVDNIVI